MDEWLREEEQFEAEERQRALREVAAAPNAATTTTGTTTAGADDEPPPCQHCGATKLDKYAWSDFGEPVCYECRSERKHAYGLVSKTKAREEFLLTDAQLAKLKFRRLRNPRKPTWGDVQLFMRAQLLRAAVGVFGSQDALEAERKRRGEARESRAKRALAKREEAAALSQGEGASADAVRQEVRRMRERVLGEAPEPEPTPQKKKPKTVKLAVDARRHEHSFGPETRNEETGLVESKCASCGLVRSFEEF